MRNMRGLGKSLIWVFALLFAAGQWMVSDAGESGSQEHRLAKVAVPKNERPSPSLHKSQDDGAQRIVNIRVKDQNDQTVVRVVGNGTFENYRFRQLSKDRFVLELPGVQSEASRASVPTRSRRLKRIYMDGTAPAGVKLIGSMQVPLGRHALKPADNELILTLYPAHEGTVEAKTHMHRQPPKRGRGRVVEPSPPPSQPKPLVGDPRSRGLSAQAPQEQEIPEEQAVLRAQMEQAIASMDNPEYSGKPISLDLQDADLNNVLRLLAEVTGANIVIEPGVSGTVNLKVEKVPWDQVLDMILTMNNLGMEEIGNVIRIAPESKLQSEEQERRAQIQAMQEEIKARQELLEATKDFGEISTDYLYISYAPPSQIANKINEIKSEKGSLSVDERTKLIIYRDYPGRLQEARRLVSRLDKATPQVLIEARIVQMDLNANKSLGFTWLFNWDDQGILNNPVAPDSDFQLNLPPGAENAFGTFGFGIGRLLGETLWDLDLRISALEQTDQAKVLSSPKVVTLDGVAASIIQGQEVPFQAESESGGTTTEFKEANLQLDVTPQITPDNRVRMLIDVAKDEFEASGAKNTRQLNTELLVESGKIVVIGGVIEETVSEQENRTPYLSSIPLVGRLFRSKNEVRSRTELLVFITPKIIQQPAGGTNAISHNRF